MPRRRTGGTSSKQFYDNKVRQRLSRVYKVEGSLLPPSREPFSLLQTDTAAIVWDGG